MAPDSSRQRANIIPNSSFNLGSRGWTGIDSNGFAVDLHNNQGASSKLKTSGNSTGANVEVTSDPIPVLPGCAMVFSCELSTAFVILGGLKAVLTCYDATGNALIDYELTKANGLSFSILSQALTTPANSAYCRVRCITLAYTTVSSGAPPGWRRLKLEVDSGSGQPSLYTQEADVILLGESLTAAGAPLTNSNPSTQAFGDAASVGVATEAARADHKHGMPPLPTPVEIGAATVAQATHVNQAALDLIGKDGSGNPTWNGGVWPGGGGAGSGGKDVPMFIAGDAFVGSDIIRMVIPSARTVVKVLLSASSAPTGADLVVDVHKNGTTIFTTQANRPSIAAGATSGTSVAPDVTNLAEGDVISIDVDQVGSTLPGTALALTIVCS